MTATAGSVVHQARFLPFGGTRGWGSAPTTAWLDRGYTGHLHNDGVGLIYMNARYYVPSLGRFASADTIVPDTTNPQQFNRFSYVLNNPIRLTDPSGHMCHSSNTGLHTNDICMTSGSLPSTTTQTNISFVSSLINFTGGDWTDAEKRAVHQGAYMFAMALARVMNELIGEAYDTIGWETAFFSIFGDKITFEKIDEPCGTRCWGERTGVNLITVYNTVGDITDLVDGSNRITDGELWAVHEIGHNFEARLGTVLGTWGPARTALSASSVLSEQGFAGGYGTWRRSNLPDFGEQFADSVVGWAYNRWEVEQRTGGLTNNGWERQSFMNHQMSLWVSQMTGLGQCGGGCR